MESQRSIDPGRPTPVASRRAFVTRGALAAAAAATLFIARPALAVSPPLTYADIPGTGDIKVLNYALALEDLEADLYAQALQRLTNGGVNALGTTIPGLQLLPTKPDVFLTREFGKVEREHRDFLRGAITAAGGPVIPMYKYDFGIQSKSRKDVLDLLYLAEKTGVGAYLGAIPLLATRTYLQTAGAIQGTEARHTAVFADLLNELFNEGLNVAPLASVNQARDEPIPPDTVLASVSPFIVVT